VRRSGKLRVGWVIYEEVGIAIINDYAISLIGVAILQNGR
jgi:hypothetical protein